MPRHSTQSNRKNESLFIFVVCFATGQFWNVPVSIEQYTGPVEETSDVDRDKIYLITVSPHAGGRPRSFLGEWYSIAWDQKSGKSSS